MRDGIVKEVETSGRLVYSYESTKSRNTNNDKNRLVFQSSFDSRSNILPTIPDSVSLESFFTCQAVTVRICDPVSELELFIALGFRMGWRTH
jgi:hypothetical protein